MTPALFRRMQPVSHFPILLTCCSPSRPFLLRNVPHSGQTAHHSIIIFKSKVTYGVKAFDSRFLAEGHVIRIYNHGILNSVLCARLVKNMWKFFSFIPREAFSASFTVEPQGEAFSLPVIDTKYLSGGKWLGSWGLMQIE